MTILLQVLFILIMCLFHFIWVGCLAVCQTYQVVWLAMTTNERMNAARYRHFQRGMNVGNTVPCGPKVI